MRFVRLPTLLGIALVFTCLDSLHAQNNLPPYSAQFKTTTVRTLPNGTTLTREITGKVARDSAGHIYREETREVNRDYHKPGLTFITIFDPTAQEWITLNPRNKIATVNHISPHPNAAPGKTTPVPPGTPRPSLGSGSSEAAGRPIFEKLGTKDIEGVTVEGTRTTKTIPAGRVGNDQPLVIVIERWFSPELRIELDRETDDPRDGVSKTEYSNIERGEPDPDLFRIPEDYTVNEVERVQAAH